MSPPRTLMRFYGVTTVRKGQALDLMPRSEFSVRFRAQFYDPAFRPHDAASDAMEAVAWDAYREGHKAPVTEKAGPEFADPGYDLSVEWRATRNKGRAADAIQITRLARRMTGWRRSTSAGAQRMRSYS